MNAESKLLGRIKYLYILLEVEYAAEGFSFRIVTYFIWLVIESVLLTNSILHSIP